MHIPDGYLSPQTTLPALAAMVPVWGVALRRVRRTLGDRQTPTLALGAAFAFVLMMCNVPVAGGTSAHAVGAVLIAILLGPWAAVVAVSAALLIQALAFGDGGILTYGVNCLNMAVVMPFVGYGVDRLVSGKARPGSTRGAVGAFLGGYVGLNAAALCAAVEFGIQPLFFHTAAGQPLYGAYPLSVTIPAMLLPHLTVAGPVDGLVTAAAAAYAMKFAPELFARRAGRAKASFRKRAKVLLIPLGVLVALTPLGLLASGTAWGEWDAAELRQRLGYVPKGFAALAGRWQALLPDYSLRGGTSGAGAAVGYVLSAVAGVGLIAALAGLLSFTVMKTRRKNSR